MSREHKYQAWHKEHKKMYRVVTLYLGTKSQGVTLIDDDDPSSTPWPHLLTCSMDEIELREFTGLVDRQGKDIYEGDIVRINHPYDRTGDFTNAVGDVFWWEEEGGWYHGNNNSRPPKRMWPYVEVIGNIYEHPELLQV